MNDRKKCAGLLLALAMCLGLAACGGCGSSGGSSGGDNGGDEESTTPAFLVDGIAIDDSIEYDYSIFLGTWSDENDNVLTVEQYDDGRAHFQLSDANDDWITSGIFQYSERLYLRP